MKRILWGLMVWMLAVGTAQAALLGRVPLTPGGTDYQAYYDDDLNITWLAVAASSTFGVTGIASNGQMAWDKAQEWIGAMNSANYFGVNNWRLPETLQPDASCSHQSFLGQSYGYGCTGSEMGHLLNVDGISLSFPDPFSNMTLSPFSYWSGTSYALDTSYAWVFGMNVHMGGQDIFPKNDHYASSVWPVRDGDIGAVPAPGALWLFGTGVAALGAKLKRRVRGTVA